MPHAARDLKGIASSVDDGDIDLNPRYQRKYIWKEEKVGGDGTPGLLLRKPPVMSPCDAATYGPAA